LGDVAPGKAIDPYEVEWRLKEAAEEGMRQGKNILLVKAEKRVRLRDLVRISSAATAVKGMKLNLAVMEKN
jgi:biopolymer transport protein ExbD